MVLWVNALAAKPDDLSLITRTHTQDGKRNAALRVAPQPPHLHTHAIVYSPIHKYLRTNKYYT